MRELWVWMNGEHVGAWSIGRTGNHRFTYAPSWPTSPRARPLSLSLPLTAANQIDGDRVRNFFDNLLPDNDAIRARLHQRFRTRTADGFDLLQAIGRDCVGAVQLLPPGQEPAGFDRVAYEPLTTAQIEHILLHIPLAAGADQGDGEDFRISIAGAQEKTALLRVDDQWCRPKGATPTTHILKLPLGVAGGNRKVDLLTSVENEWLCLRILEAMGLPVAAAEIATFGEQKALVVERFDRAWIDDQWIARLPQEDFCQVFGTPPSTKYEADGGPGIYDALTILAGSDTPEEDGLTFLCAQFAFWLLAATDGHAKNFSIFLHHRGQYAMTPLYDVLSAWPAMGPGPNQIAWQKSKLAMAVRAKNTHYKLCEIQSRHWHHLAINSRIPHAWLAMLEIAEFIEDALAKVADQLPPGFPAHIVDSIFAGIRRQVTAFRQGLAHV